MAISSWEVTPILQIGALTGYSAVSYDFDGFFSIHFLRHPKFPLTSHRMRMKQLIILILLTAVVVMMGLVPLSMASHSIDHHHHSAGTHTTGICAWMCTAAQTISTDSQIFSPNISQLEFLEIQDLSSTHSPLPPFRATRAPPFYPVLLGVPSLTFVRFDH